MGGQSDCAMLTGTERPARIASRIRGKAALLKSLRGLLVRAHRYANHRTRTRADIEWAAVLIDALGVALTLAELKLEGRTEMGNPATNHFLSGIQRNGTLPIGLCSPCESRTSVAMSPKSNKSSHARTCLRTVLP